MNKHTLKPTSYIRACDVSLIRCHCCGQLSHNHKIDDDDTSIQYCSRCHSKLHIRKPQSLQKTFAFLIAATILYIPANILPMTITNSLFGSQQDTIMSGVIYFWATQDYLVATVIFTASIFIPLLKLFILIFLLLSIYMQSLGRWKFSPRHCSILYRVVEMIGRWSMIDVFVVSLLAALIQIQSLATILAGTGAVAFGAVVILTMLASMSFDPRMIWDNYYSKNNRHISQDPTEYNSTDSQHSSNTSQYNPLNER
ncbi:paraquat-inducible protein A [Acinetobacter sp. B5B]|uniref:paraquat-inducible protein A n=1 Tax=Acinetobacter baretiae TaxID=2605383 RepID=UPI0018C2EAC4|nr:paraquat-inducible protein A [Acinetobacter baretiae]MBF7682405.1 paraquat-inducible protein A [Acinetobacter baretiae]